MIALTVWAASAVIAVSVMTATPPPLNSTPLLRHLEKAPGLRNRAEKAKPSDPIAQRVDPIDPSLRSKKKNNNKAKNWKKTMRILLKKTTRKSKKSRESREKEGRQCVSCWVCRKRLVCGYGMVEGVECSVSQVRSDPLSGDRCCNAPVSLCFTAILHLPQTAPKNATRPSEKPSHGKCQKIPRNSGFLSKNPLIPCKRPIQGTPGIHLGDPERAFWDKIFFADKSG